MVGVVRKGCVLCEEWVEVETRSIQNGAQTGGIIRQMKLTRFALRVKALLVEQLGNNYSIELCEK
jgi:hypothetical protein